MSKTASNTLIRPNLTRALLISSLLVSGIATASASGALPADSARGSTGQSLIKFVAGLEEPLIAMGDSSGEETADLESTTSALLEIPGNTDFPARAQLLTDFLSRHPDSVWRASIMFNLGSGYYHAGYFTRAFDAWQAAWQTGRDRTDPREKALIDRAYGELVRMHARVGHASALEELFESAGARPISGPATEMVTGAHEGLWMFKNDWGIAYLCGPMALKNLLIGLGASHEQTAILDGVRSGPSGFTFAQVGELAARVGLDHSIVHRMPGDPIPVPSIVNWKVNHYAAILEEANGRYRIQDPTFASGDLWMTAAAIDEESSGFFLVPDSVQPEPQWRLASASEATAIFGMGFTSVNQLGATGNCDRNADPPGPTSGGDMPGMCMANAKAMVVSVNLRDRPLGYRPPKGAAPDLTVTYNQREAYQPAVFSFFNIGPKWTLGAIAYIQDDPATAGASVVRYMPGGGAIDYVHAQYQFNTTTGAFSAEIQGGAVLVRSPATGPVAAYLLNMPDGSQHIYGQFDNSNSYPRRVFLSQIIDAAGNASSYTYDAVLRLRKITDATGRDTTFNYGSSFSSLLVTQIVDPMGRHADLTYDNAGRLATITDVIGLTSAFQYDASGLVNAMVTPYGTTRFIYYYESRYNTRYLEATDPMGYTERVEFRQQAPGINNADPVNPSDSDRTCWIIATRFTGTNTSIRSRIRITLRRRSRIGCITRAVTRHRSSRARKHR